MSTAFVSDRRLYLTRDDRVVEEGDPEAFMLLVARGGRVSFQVARRYGLGDGAPAVEAQALPAAPANKAITRTPRKG